MVAPSVCLKETADSVPSLISLCRQSSPVSSHFSLPDDILFSVLEFVGNGSFLLVGGVNRSFLKACKDTCLGHTQTYFSSAFQSWSCVRVALPVLCADPSLAAPALRAAFRVGDVSMIRHMLARADDEKSQSETFSLASSVSNAISALRGCGEGGHVDLLSLIEETGVEVENREGFLTALRDGAMSRGKLEILELMVSRGWQRVLRDVPFTMRHESPFREAVREGHTQIVHWGLKAQYLSETVVSELVGRYAPEAAVKRLAGEGVSLGDWACLGAACEGRLEVLKTLRALEVPWSPEVCWICLRKGFLEVLVWARRNGAPWWESTRKAVEECVEKGGKGAEVLRQIDFRGA
eukprot:Cvel_25744.t2-p1 / transcript=Cvel_25744.t2 / gene=Cvel_25744 / organism=Chromera_velia_CCMP2878 / gene_product=hypothetical protein / transcript_product=hypothetical protein / location=Cvel_scaffold2962:7001-8050(-) / protein_length=350 / sequence_SO=supercontig / SO=protein_coding / is_pseudo=false